MNTNQAFAQARDNIKLDRDELDEAIKVHNQVTEHLKKKGLIVGAFLQGSLARKTMIKPLRDIDKVVLLAVDYRNRPNGVQDAANDVARALAELFPDLVPEIDKHCVKLDFGEHTFSFDIVPAIDLGDDIDIIDTKNNIWKRSNTRELIRVVQQRNQDCAGNFVHQARLIKQFGRHQLDGCVPGLHLESLAFPAIPGVMNDDEALAAALAEGARALAPGGTYFDPTGKDELGRRLDPAVRARAHTVFVTAAAAAADAVRQRVAGNHNAAIAIWHDMLGDAFPKPDPGQALNALNIASGVSTTGVVTPSATVKPTSTRSWRPA